MRINILLLILITSFGLKAQNEQLFSEFLELFPGQKIPAEFQSKFLEIDGPFPEERLQFEKRYAKKIIEKTGNYILLSVRYQCIAGGLCESVNLYSFKLTGQLISTSIFSKKNGDCSFRHTITPIYFDNKTLVTKEHEWEGDCNEDTTRYELIKINEYIIQQNGQIQIKQGQRIELRRKYSNSSTELLNEEYLNKLSKDELSTIRNEIFAAHGYKFKTKKWSAYFKNTDWYIPKFDTITEKQLSFIEQKNLELIKAMEKRKTPHNNGS